MWQSLHSVGGLFGLSGNAAMHGQGCCTQSPLTQWPTECNSPPPAWRPASQPLDLRADTSSDSDDQPASLRELPAVRTPAGLLAGNLSKSVWPSRQAAAFGSSPNEPHSPAADAEADDPTLAVAPSPSTAADESPTAVTVAASEAAATASSSDGRVAGDAQCVPSVSSSEAAAQGPLAARRMQESSARVSLDIFKDASAQQQLRRVAPMAMVMATRIAGALMHPPDRVDPAMRNAFQPLVDSCHGCSSFEQLSGPITAATIAVSLAAGEPADMLEPLIKELQQALPNQGTTSEAFLQHMRSVLAHLGAGHLADQLVQLWCQHIHDFESAAPRRQQQQQQVQAAEQLPVGATAAAVAAFTLEVTAAPSAAAGCMPAHHSLCEGTSEVGSDISVLRLRGGRGGSIVTSSIADTETDEDEQPAQVSGPGPHTTSAGTTGHFLEQSQLVQSVSMDPSQQEIANRRLRSRDNVENSPLTQAGIDDFKDFLTGGESYMPGRRTGCFMSINQSDWRLRHFNIHRKDLGYCYVEATDYRQVAWRAVITVKGVTWRAKARLHADDAARDADR